MKYVVAVEGQDVEIEVDGEQVRVGDVTRPASLEAVPGTPLSLLTFGGRPVTVALEDLGRGRWVVGIGGRRVELEVLDERTRHIRSLTASEGGSAGGGHLKAPMPGLVVRVQVALGQAVHRGEPLIVLEAMKMENQLKAPSDGVVTEIRATEGSAVEKGQILVALEAGPAAT